VTNYFQVFDLAPRVAIDVADLQARYEQIILLCHPDKYAGAPAFEQRAAAKRAADVNEAYEVLAHTVARAGHLLALRGVDIQSLERQPASPDFLFEQMTLREEVQMLNTLTDAEAVALSERITTAYDDAKNKFAYYFDADDLAAASSAWVELHYQHKLTDELSRAKRQVS
jgi:molecular chaperone HscB